jgi:hypothetical protein
MQQKISNDDDVASNSIRYKTVACKFFGRTGSCRKGLNCTYAHGDHELRNLTDPLPPIPREVLLYCPPNMKLLPNHGNIQIIPPKQRMDGQSDFSGQNTSGVFFDGGQ